MVSYDDFIKIDMRLGKIIDVQDFPEARKASFKLKIDFGPEIGIKTSSVQLPGAYKKEELSRMLVVGVVNFPPKRVANFTSEVLTLGFANTEGGGFILVSPSKNCVAVGDKLR